METTKTLLWIIAYIALFIFSLFLAIHVRDAYFLWKLTRMVKKIQKQEHGAKTNELLNELLKVVEKQKKDHSIFKGNNED